MTVLAKMPGAHIENAPPVTPPAYVLPPRGTQGVLALFEPGHPDSVAKALSALPAAGFVFNDIAEDWVADTLGGPSGGLVVSNNTIVNATGTTGSAYGEFTADHGIHVASAQSGASSTPYQNFSVSLGAARRDFVTASATAGDAWFIDLWGRQTRSPKSTYTSGVLLSALRRGTNVTDLYAAAGVAGSSAWVFPSSGARMLGSRADKKPSGIYQASVAAQTALSNAFVTALNFILMGAVNTGTLNVLGGDVIYRAYFENLTKSGRTHTQVLNASFEEYGDQCLTAGGRYFADTWTNPTTKVL